MNEVRLVEWLHIERQRTHGSEFEFGCGRDLNGARSHLKREFHSEQTTHHDCSLRACAALKTGDSDAEADDFNAMVSASAGTNPCAKRELRHHLRNSFELNKAVYNAYALVAQCVVSRSSVPTTMVDPRVSNHPHFLFPFTPGPTAQGGTVKGQAQTDKSLPIVRLTPRRLRLLSVRNVPGSVCYEFRTDRSEVEDGGGILRAQYTNVSSVKKVAMELHNEIYRVALQMEDYSIWFKLVLFAKAFPDPFLFNRL
jgi:hypothetical protein